MKIEEIKTTPLYCKFKQTYHWPKGVNYGATVILVEIETDSGIVGIGESVVSPSAKTVISILNDTRPHLVGRSVYDGNRMIWGYYRDAFITRGTADATHYFPRLSPVLNLLYGMLLEKRPIYRCTGYWAALSGIG